MSNIQLDRLLLAGCMSVMVLIIACDKWDYERIAFTQVITVGALEVGFSSAFLLGDIEGLRNANIVETGFVYSSTTADDQSLRLAQENVEVVMSPRLEDSIITEDRAFAARVTDLGASTKYFFRAYIILEGSENAYGAIDTLTTSNLVVSAATINRNASDCATTVTITVNVSGASSTPDNSFGVLWSTDEANPEPLLGAANQVDVTLLDPQGNLEVDLPIKCNTSYFVRGFFKTKETETYGPVEAFSTTSGGDWIPAGTFPDQPNRRTCYYPFSNNEFGFVLVQDLTKTQHQLWKFDPQGLNWQTAKDPPPMSLCREPLAAKIFFAGDDLSVEFWQYNILTNQWDSWSRVPSSGGSSYGGGFVFLHNSTLFWGTGINRVTNTVYKEGWWVPVVSATTRPLADFPGAPRHSTSYFTLGSSGYVGLGQDEEGQFFKDFWKLDFGAKSWSPVVGLSDEIRSSLDFTTNGKAYILTGYDANEVPLPNFYEYDPALDQWTRLADFGPGDGTADIGFAIDGIIYGGLGISANGEVRREIWRYIAELE